jgi:hypothetical protein
MMSRKKALDDVEQGQESFCCLLSAWVSVDSISLTHAQVLAGRHSHGTLNPCTALQAGRSFALPCSWVENDRIGGTFSTLCAVLTMCVFLARLQGALDRYDRSRQALVIAAWREDSPFPFSRAPSC